MQEPRQARGSICGDVPCPGRPRPRNRPVVAAFPASGGTASYYVSPSGNDTNPCTASLPCREIRQPLRFVVAGDTILVADGSYKGFDVADIHGVTARTRERIGQPPSKRSWP
jgi:hypothetical protein